MKNLATFLLTIHYSPFTIHYFCSMVGMKKFSVAILLMCCSFASFGQDDSTNRAETTRKKSAIIPIEDIQPPTPKKKTADSDVSRNTHNTDADSVLRSNARKQARLLRDSLLADSIKKAVISIKQLTTKIKFENRWNKTQQ